MEIPKVLRDQFMKFWYWFVSRRDKDSVLTFMNYGFSNHHEVDLAQSDEFNRYPIQLYDYIASHIDLSGLDVLEVGSGRGGGAEYITRSFKPRSYNGLDLNQRAVNFCNKHYSYEQLRFKQGNALNLPFDDNSFDVVINVESSHRYPNMSKFFDEVSRVLKPNGFFLYTDFTDDFLVKPIHEKLSNSSLTIKKHEVITPWIVKALDLDHQRRVDLIRDLAPPAFRGIARRFSGIKGTPMYQWFQSGRVEYFYYVLQNENGVKAVDTSKAGEFFEFQENRQLSGQMN